jgi:hypothetical protein
MSIFERIKPGSHEARMCLLSWAGSSGSSGVRAHRQGAERMIQGSRQIHHAERFA